MFSRFSPGLSRNKDGYPTGAAGIPRGSTQVSVGPTLRDFVPSTFPPNVAEIVRIDPSVGELRNPLEELSAIFVGERSVSTRTRAERQIITAGHRRRHPFQEVVA